MSASVRWSGLDELIRDLRNLPEALAGEASSIVIGAAQAAKDSIHYPRQDGDLAEGLVVETRQSGRYGAGARLRNKAKHAHLFEYGTEVRRTRSGWNRGRMPAGNVFLPAVIRERRRMYERLKELLRRHGAARVSGDAT